MMSGDHPFGLRVAISYAVLLLTLACTAPSHAAKTIYRCNNNGQVTLSDQPCESAETNTPAATASQSKADPPPVGSWTGQIQYQGIEAGTMIQDAHSVVLLALNFSADGKITGGSPDNGCEWLGIWSRGTKGAERLISVDVSFKGCRYPGLDRRYNGSFTLGVRDGSGAMKLLAYTTPAPGTKVRAYDASGTLQRAP